MGPEGYGTKEGLPPGNVFVHCEMGASRSASCLAAYLMAHLDLPKDTLRISIGTVALSHRKSVSPKKACADRGLQSLPRLLQTAAGLPGLRVLDSSFPA